MSLSHGNWSLALRPELGAAVTRLTWRDHDIFRPTPNDATDLLESASFPLIPYANRIANGAFAFHDLKIVLPPTPRFEPHALHGVGWLRPWSVRRSEAALIDLTLTAEADADWPWVWTASHSLRLSDEGLEMTLSLTNQDSAPMPAGLGFHPYFATEDRTVMTLAANGVWLTDADIPSSLALPVNVVDWRSGARTIDAPFVDNAYAGWSREARLDHHTHVVTITAEANARWVQIYAPGRGGFVCIEPVTHRPDAHNAPATEDAGLVALAPGQTLTTSMRITAFEPRAHT